MNIRHADLQDITALLALYDNARAFMQSQGNISQWGDSYPSKELITLDIMNRNCYICEENHHLLGAFTFFTGDDETYRKIDGAWQNDLPYGVVHRLASADRKKGTASFCLDWCYKKHPNLRIDTHRDNLPMQRLLLKKGFQECGIIWVTDNSERIAFHKP